MNKRQFWTMAIFQAFETYFFNDAVMRESYLAAIFWALLILRNFASQLYLRKLVESIDQQLNQKKQRKSKKISTERCFFLSCWSVLQVPLFEGNFATIEPAFLAVLQLD